MNQGLSLENSPVGFESIKKISPYGAEYWSARELMTHLGYIDWRNFERAVEDAKKACTGSGQKLTDHIVEANKMILAGKGAERLVSDYFLSRYACYLVAQNGDPNKPEIASAQTYFAIQTRRQELSDQEVTPDLKRIEVRTQLKESNKRLSGAAKEAGVRSRMFGVFNDAGYKGLYGGKGVKDIKLMKGVPDNEDLLDRMGATELAANLFRTTQTEERLRQENIQSETTAINIHSEVGRGVRNTIVKLGNPLPEDLPTETNIKKLYAKQRKEERLLKQARP